MTTEITDKQKKTLESPDIRFEKRVYISEEVSHYNSRSS